YAARIQNLLNEVGGRWVERLGGWERLGLGAADGSATRSDLISGAVSWAVAFLRSLLQSGQAVTGVLFTIVVAPIVTFYLLIDWPRMIQAIDSWLPRERAPAIRRLAREINAAISASLRGQALVCLFLACWYGIGLSLTGLNFGLLIGLSSGLLSVIPYVGS